MPISYEIAGSEEMEAIQDAAMLAFDLALATLQAAAPIRPVNASVLLIQYAFGFLKYVDREAALELMRLIVAFEHASDEERTAIGESIDRKLIEMVELEGARACPN